MSLKAFHIFFILVSIVISLGFAAWVIMGGAGERTTLGLQVMGWFSAVLSIGLVVYGVFFIRKARSIII